MASRLTRPGWPGLALDAWVTALSAYLCWPLLVHGGYPLARDLVFTPRQPMTTDAIGLGTGAPRAVPLDALVWLLEHVADGAVVARVAVLGALLVAGWGAHRLVSAQALPARVLVAGFAVWNPFVVERLALGQWALLWSYAAAFWLVGSAARHREGGPLMPAVGWLAVSSITPTGGVVGTLVLLVVGAHRWARTARLAAVALFLQLPWVLPGVLSAASVTSDPAGVAAFAGRSERPGGAVLSLLGLGGVWDAGSAPTSRAGVLGYVSSLLVVVVLVVGTRLAPRFLGTTTIRRLVGLAVGGFLLAAGSSVPGVENAMTWTVGHVPGAGLLRDSQKWLLPFVLLVVVALGSLANAIWARLRAGAGAFLVPVAAVFAVLPLLVLPDGAVTTWATVRPVHYPAGFAAVRRALGTGPDGDIVVLPWRAYRLFSWGQPVSVYDPASRWFDRSVVSDDELQVGDMVLATESARTREVGEALGFNPPAAVLGPLGVRYAVVYGDDPEAGRLDLRGLRLVAGDRYVRLYEVPGPVASVAEVPSWKQSAVVVANLAALGLALYGGASAFVARMLLKRRSVSL